MNRTKRLAAAVAALLAVPALAQTTTYGTPPSTPLPPPTQPQQQPAAQPPPPVIVTPPASPPPSTVVVTPPAQPSRSSRSESRATSTGSAGDASRRAPMATVGLNALYGGAAGALIGLGVALIEQDHYARDISIGAGVGVIAGAIVGGIMAYSDETYDRVAVDGLGTPARDRGRQRPMTPVAGYAMRW